MEHNYLCVIFIYLYSIMIESEAHHTPLIPGIGEVLTSFHGSLRLGAPQLLPFLGIQPLPGQFPGQQFPGQQFPGQFPGQQFPGQFPGQQFPGQQYPQNYNSNTNPNYNPNANPNYNPNANPNYNPNANSNYNPNPHVNPNFNPNSNYGQTPNGGAYPGPVSNVPNQMNNNQVPVTPNLAQNQGYTQLHATEVKLNSGFNNVNQQPGNKLIQNPINQQIVPQQGTVPNLGVQSPNTGSGIGTNSGNDPIQQQNNPGNIRNKRYTEKNLLSKMMGKVLINQ